MKRQKNKLLGSILFGAIILTSSIYIQSSNGNVVFAAESKALKEAKANISHLTYSLKTNYLGLKNQGVWELYIKTSRSLIDKIPSKESKSKQALTNEVNRGEALVKSLSRINQVEKSITPKSQGGYGNYLGIKNAEVWNQYLSLAKVDLGKVDKNIFKKQYDELISRMNKVSTVVKNIEDEFQAEYNKVSKMFFEAKESKDINKAKAALVEAEKLGTCSRSDILELNIKRFIDNKDTVDFEKYENARFGFSVEYPKAFTDYYESDNGDGCIISGDFDIMVYGSQNLDYYTDKRYDGYSYYDDMKEYFVVGKLISKKITKDSIEVLSLDDDIFYYTKVVLGKKTINTIELEYLESQSKENEDLIRYIVNSFKTPNVNFDQYHGI